MANWSSNGFLLRDFFSERFFLYFFFFGLSNETEWFDVTISAWWLPVPAMLSTIFLPLNHSNNVSRSPRGPIAFIFTMRLIRASCAGPCHDVRCVGRPLRLQLIHAKAKNPCSVYPIIMCHRRWRRKEKKAKKFTRRTKKKYSWSIACLLSVLWSMNAR